MQVSFCSFVLKVFFLYATGYLLILALLQTEVWEGPKLSFGFCSSFLGIQKADYVSHLGTFLSAFISENSVSGVQVWHDAGHSGSIVNDVFSQRSGSITPMDLLPVLHQLRLIKSKAEQELMRNSCAIIASAVIETMKVCSNRSSLYCI